MTWRALVLTVDPAAPPISGADLRNWQNASALASIGEVTLASLRPMSGPSHVLDGRIECVAITDTGEARSPALARRRSRIDVRVTRSTLDRLLALASKLKPDAILVEGIPLFPFLEHLRPMTSMLILDMHNIESDVAAQIGARGLGDRILAGFVGSHADRIRALEREALAIVDGVWVCSEADRGRLHELFGRTEIAVVPNGIPRLETAPAELPEPARKAAGWPVILFVGHLDYPPNVAATIRLAGSILPLVRRQCPDARLLIAGRAPSSELLALATGPEIELIPDPEDLIEIYARSHLTVIPLLSGGGTRIKILEAIMHGLPVVATSLAVEGLDLEDGRETLVADTDRGLAAQVAMLCSDPDRFEALRRNARSTVMSRFGRDAITATVREAIASTAHKPVSSGR